MIVAVVVITKSRVVAECVDVRRNTLVAIDLLAKLRGRGMTVSVKSILVETMKDHSKISEYFLNIDRSIGGIIFLCEEDLMPYISPFRTAILLKDLDSAMGGTSIVNHMRQVTARILKVFMSYAGKFNDAAFQRLLLLPARNFIAHEIEELENLFSRCTGATDFGERLDAILTNLRRRQSPKKSTKYKELFIVDDEGRNFSYGKERHAQNETACPPHHLLCLVTANFRFGIRYDSRRHYNVSQEGDRIAGVFTDCHGARSLLPSRSHVNVFPNDFFA